MDASSPKKARELRRELAALLKTAADKADEWKQAVAREWEPYADKYYEGNLEITPDNEHAYAELRLGIAVGGNIRRESDYLAADEKADKT